MKLSIVLLLVLTLAGCTSSITMQHPITGKTAQCGPYYYGGMSAKFASVDRERGCISDFQRQGYERVSN